MIHPDTEPKPWHRLGRLKRPVDVRFWEKVDKNGPMPVDPWTPLTSSCWMWLGAHDALGYGMFRFDGQTRRAHRAAYEIAVGPVPAGLQLDHLCRVRDCVNPDHLDPVTKRVNALRSKSPFAEFARATHCGNGHPYDEENTIYEQGRRRCRICKAEWRRRSKARREGMI